MDANRFDRLTRAVGAVVTRRGALGALLAGATASVLAGASDAAKRGNGTRKRGGQERDKKRDKNKKRNKDRKDRKPRARAEATRCCSTGNCAPGKGKNLSKCCYQGQDLSGKNFSGANLDSANFAGAILKNANLQGANAGKACLVDADLRGVKTNGSTNLGGAVYCRTRTDNGENNSGCGLGTPCCPTCDDAHPCADGEVCCDGRCRECCGTSVQSTCDDGDICCADSCVAGECCAAADCPTETCQRKSCRNHQCAYDPVFGEPGPRCQTICCEDAQDDPVCCGAGVTNCQASGICGCVGDNDCGSDERCCAGHCVPRTQCCAGDNPAGCNGDLHCCVVSGTGVCRACCDAAQCPDETCQTKNCGANGTCAYTPQFGSTGTDCATVCCENADDQPVCCSPGATTCAASRTCPPDCDVCPSGCRFTNLKAAVEGTPANGTIRICPGTYPTNLVPIAKNLTIIGSGAGSDPTIHSILDGGNINAIMNIVDVTVTIQDLTVTRGKGAGLGGGIEVFFDAMVTLERVEIVGNSASSTSPFGNAAGGLTVFRGSTVVIKSSRIANNTSTTPNGGGGISNFGTLTLEATRVEKNSSLNGGGINNDGRLTLNTGAVVTMNTATKPTPSGGGIYNLGTIVDNDTGNNVFDNDPDDCINASSGTGCPA